LKRGNVDLSLGKDEVQRLNLSISTLQCTVQGFPEAVPGDHYFNNKSAIPFPGSNNGEGMLNCGGISFKMGG
jgi:hypothetical protein